MTLNGLDDSPICILLFVGIYGCPPILFDVAPLEADLLREIPF